MKMWLVKMPGKEGALFDNRDDAEVAATDDKPRYGVANSSLAVQMGEDRRFAEQEDYKIVEVECDWFA